MYNLTLVDDNVYYANGILVQNCFDSLVIAVEGARQRGFTIAKLENTSTSEQDTIWKREAREKARTFWRSGQLSYK